MNQMFDFTSALGIAHALKYKFIMAFQHPLLSYISQLIRFARVSSHVAEFNAHNKSLTAKLLQQGYRYHKLRKTFSNFYRRHYELVSKSNVGLKTLLHQGLYEPEFYGDLVYKFKKIVRRADFSDQFRKIIVRYKRIRYNKYNATVCMLSV